MTGRVRQVTLEVDGGARGNPGPAGIGALLFGPDGDEIARLSEFIGPATNNEAEYRALIRGLEAAAETLSLGDTRIVVRTDSELVARQLTGRYKVKEERLQLLCRRAHGLLAGFASWEVLSVPREANRRADKLVNEAIDQATRPCP
jgi:ribonuclease HI